MHSHTSTDDIRLTEATHYKNKRSLIVKVRNNTFSEQWPASDTKRAGMGGSTLRDGGAEAN